ncbi:shikimate kinase [Sinobaca qinghaiensis]|uniref:Shikimate kinase n=1 Tax=Sinobaca qinghaiensis TaxID=342944 RepID=A0A419UWM8_9BACL|nr:shikimate kinase [Sinobaca qinghaiensis]RKD69538.1 shikimate kinase [Sinobaca qinghaiensis]
MSSVVMIGPICSGKSTVSALLADMLQSPRCCMDSIRFSYYKELGFSEEKQEHIRKKEGFPGVYQYWKPFEAHAVKRALEDFPDHIHDFGAGHSVQEEQGSASVVKKALHAAEVFLLLPSPDIEKSKNILRQQLLHRTHNPAVLDINDYFAEHGMNRELADHIIYTDNKSAQTVGIEIKKILQESARHA